MSSQPTLIAGRYEIDTLIGRGGMGDVYRGTDTHTGHLVAIKLLHASIVLDNPDLVDRFQREGEALGQLNHPNIVKLLGGVEEGDKHYLIMEYVGGGSLRDLLDDQSRLPLEAVLNIALDLADALTRAHRLNIIHRDIKPDNVLLAEDATPRLTDFGVAHLGDRTRLTQTGSVIGTYAYLSPEACNGLELDERADIWSFGVMLYEMLAGRVPFQENSTAAVITAILTKPAPDLLRLRPGLPEALVALIIKMLEKDRDRRISSVRLVGAELEAIIRGLDTPLRSLIATIQEKAGSSRFTTPPEGEQDVPAMARSDPHQTHGLSLYPTPGGGTPAAVTPPGSRTPPEGVVLYTADGIPVTTQTMAPAAFKIKWIALTLIVTVLACTGLIALALILDLGNRSDDGEQDSDVLIPDGTFEISVPGETNPLMAAVEPVEPGEYMVLVAQVENQAGVVHPDGTGSGDISRAITSDLRENLERTVAFSNIRVRSYPRVITSEEDALAAAEQNGAAVIVWGGYTVDEVELTIQIGSLAPFKYIQFEREVLDRTANVRVTMTNARTQSVAPQVLGIFSLLQNADGNGFETLRIGAIQDVLQVSPVQIIGNTLAAAMHRFLMTDSLDEAAQHLEEALLLDASNPLIYTQYSVLHLRQSNVDQAYQDLLTAQRLGPAGWSMPPLLLANLAHDESVLDLFAQVIAARPDDWFPLFFRGSIYYTIADDIPTGFIPARQDIEASIALNPTANFPYVYYALLALHDGQIENARQAIWITLTEFPDPSYLTRLMRATFQETTINPYEVVLSAFTNQTLGRYNNVLEDTQRGIEALPEDQDDLFFLAGMAHCALGDYEAADQAFSNEIEATPTFVFAYLMRADARLHLEDSAGADADFAFIADSDLSAALAPYVAQVKAGTLGCANFFTPIEAPSGALPMPMMSAEPTTTPAEGSPVIEPVAPGEYMVLVADIEPLAGVEPRDVARFIAESLTRSFEEEIPTSGLRVRRYPAVILSSDEARSIAQQYGATIVVWGTYAAEGVELEIQAGDLKRFPYIPFERELVESSADVRVTLTNERRESVAPQVLNMINILAAADGDEYAMIGTLMFAQALQSPGAELAGNSVAAHIHRALFLFSQDTGQAVAELDAALALDSSNPLIYIFRGMAKLRLGQLESAASDLETARRLGPSNWALPLYLSSEEDTDKLFEIYAQIIALRPNDWFVYFMRATSYYYGENDLDAARADLEKVITLEADTAVPYIPAIMIALRQGRMIDAQALMREMLTAYPDPSLTTRAMSALYGEDSAQMSTGAFFAASTNLVLGQYEQVITDSQPVIDSLEANPPTQEQLDQIGYEMVDVADLLLIVGLSYCNLGDYKMADMAYDYATLFSPGFELLYLLRGQAQQAMGDNTGAQTSFAHARVHVLGDEFDTWVKAGIAGEWSCENLLEYEMGGANP